MADKNKTAARKSGRMDHSTLTAMLESEKQDALAAVAAADLSYERARAMDYYLGRLDDDDESNGLEGRSSVVSTDVSDAIEGFMPQLMDIFAGSDEVVHFDPVGPDDEEAAQEETDYVNHVFMQQNPGFMILYSFVKDALLSKVGIVKVWWEEREEEQRETYYDLSDDQFMVLLNDVMQSDGQYKIVEHTIHNGPDDEEGEKEPVAGEEPKEDATEEEDEETS